MTVRALVAGVGNILRGDDGFGVEVAKHLRSAPPAEGVRVVDFGIRALHLAYELCDPYDLVVIVDAMSRGSPPGTLYVLDPETRGDDVAAGVIPDAHGLDPGAVLRMAAQLGGRPRRVRIVGCEPANLDEGIGLSDAARASVGEAVRIVNGLLEEARTEAQKENAP